MKLTKVEQEICDEMANREEQTMTNVISFFIGLALGAWLGFSLAAVMVVKANEKRRNVR